MTRGRLHLLDGFRGLAAVAVVLWHYQHFYIIGDKTAPVVGWASLAPMSEYLNFFYSNGHLAVEFFWVLSGFVFFFSFSGSHPTFRKFFIGRLSRIYPLHFVTLVVAAGLQVAFVALYGYQKIWNESDLSAFISHLFLASNWLSSAPFSFNAPIWSVSAEIVSYALFYLIVVRLGAAKYIVLIAVFSSFFLLRYLEGHSYVLSCGYFFFFGSFIARVFESVKEHEGVLLSIASAFGLMAFTVFWFSPDSLRNLLTVYFVAPSVSAFIILALSWLERYATRRVLKVSEWLGSVSFGIYLWHVPIQLFIFLLLENWLDVTKLSSSPIFFIVFFAILVAVAHFSFVWIEKPARDRIRVSFSGDESQGLRRRR